MVTGFITALLVVVLTALVFYRRGVRAGQKSVLQGRGEDALLREAEAEVDALLPAITEASQYGPVPLPPAEEEHPRLTNLQRRAISALVADGLQVEYIRLMVVQELEPASGKKNASFRRCSGGFNTRTGEPDSLRDRGARVKLGTDTWSYLRRVIDSRARQNYSWVFMYGNGETIDSADILTCPPMPKRLSRGYTSTDEELKELAEGVSADEE